ncbi:MAG: hypothetical protein KGI03_00945 [Patescibacteria group bacterium]|nr:hypothetical protein [Patescibacteria group bacterium]
MQTNEKIGIAGALAALVFLVGIVWLSGHQQSPQAAQPKVGAGFTEMAFDSNNDSGATTTLTYLGSGSATTTMLDRYVANGEQYDLNMFEVASSSSSCVQWYNEFSNNNQDWYQEDGTNLSSNVLSQEGAGGLLHTWCPGQSATTTKNITIKPTAEKYYRLRMKATGADSSMYAQLVVKAIIAN